MIRQFQSQTSIFVFCAVSSLIATTVWFFLAWQMSVPEFFTLHEQPRMLITLLWFLSPSALFGLYHFRFRPAVASTAHILFSSAIVLGYWLWLPPQIAVKAEIIILLFPILFWIAGMSIAVASYWAITRAKSQLKTSQLIILVITASIGLILINFFAGALTVGFMLWVQVALGLFVLCLFILLGKRH